MSDPDGFLAVTHEVLNQPRALADYHLYSGDQVLRAAAREGAAWVDTQLTEFGQAAGTAEPLPNPQGRSKARPSAPRFIDSN